MASAPPTRPALRERYDRRRQDVVDAAARVFATRGFHATSIQDLVDATGLAAGGLYHYIGSKDELLVRICDRLMEPLLEQVREIAARDEPPERRLRAFVRAWMHHVERHRHHVLVFQQERHVLQRGAQWKRVRRQRKEFEQLLDRLLEELDGAGALRAADRDLALRALLGMVNHSPQWFRSRGRLTADQVADGYVDLLVAVAPAASACSAPSGRRSPRRRDPRPG